MSKLFPELVFTRGAQRGQRVELSKTMNILGRDPTCDIEIQDEYASRQHARIVVEGTRVRMINISPNGTKVNGKLTEQAVLAHGDLLGFGLECEARVETPEGPALAPAAAAATAASAAAAGPTAPAAPAAAPAGARPAEGKPAEPKPGEPAESPEAARKKASKKPTMIFWVGIYLVALFGIFILLKLLLPSGPAGAYLHGTVALTDPQIEEYIEKPMEPLELNPRLASEALARAQAGYDAWKTGTTGPEHLYLTLGEFKRALAYMHKRFFDDAVKLQEMEEIKKALIDEVRVTYKNAYTMQRAGRWRQAMEGYHALQKIIVDTQDPIYKNALEQLNVVNANLAKQKERSGPKGGW